jgi:hypothetical protein
VEAVNELDKHKADIRARYMCAYGTCRRRRIWIQMLGYDSDEWVAGEHREGRRGRVFVP